MGRVFEDPVYAAMAAETGDESTGFAFVDSEATSATQPIRSGGMSDSSGDLIAVSGAMTPETAIKVDEPRERGSLASL
jgi:hypothetical protein